MKLELADIKDFQRLWKEQFNSDITEQEAEEKATHLLELMKVIYRPLPKPKESDSTSQLSILDY